MLNLLDKFVIWLIACMTVGTCKWVVSRFAAVRVTSATSLSNSTTIRIRLMLIKWVWFLPRISINNPRVAAISFVCNFIIIILLIRRAIFVLFIRLSRTLLCLFRSWAVSRFILWCTLWRLILILIFNINIYFNGYHQRLIALDIIWACSPCPTFWLILWKDFTGLTLLNTTFLPRTAQMIDLQIFNLFTFFDKVSCLRVSFLLRKCFVSWWNLSLLHLWLRWKRILAQNIAFVASHLSSLPSFEWRNWLTLGTKRLHILILPIISIILSVHGSHLILVERMIIQI